MAIKLRRGLNSDRITIIFEQGEIVFTTDTKKVYIGDGSTAGGVLVTGEDLLSQLNDILLTSPVDGDGLIYNGTTNLWENSNTVTTQGNTFNAANKLVQLDATAKLPAVDGSQLTNLPSFTPPDGLLKIASAISTTFQRVTDYLANNSVLFLNSRRIGIGKDTSVTTQSVAVLDVQDANTSIVLKPNGTGAIIASVPDGTATGGIARGNYTVDLQLVRTNANQVTIGVNSVIIGGQSNIITGSSSACAGNSNNISGNNSVAFGYSNTISGSASVAFGYTNTASSTYSTISGGQSNTASTNTHATVVGGSANTSSGQYSVSGGLSCTASGLRSVAFGNGCISSGDGSVAIGNGCQAGANGGRSISIGDTSTAQAIYSTALGRSSLAYLVGQMSYASNTFVSQGDAQQSLLTARKSDTLTTGATTVLSLDGTGTTNLIIPNGNNRAWNVQIDTIAVVTAITGTATGVSVGDCYRETKQLLFKRIGGTSSIVGSVDTTAIKSDTSMSTAALTVTAGASQQMALTFTAPSFAGGGSVTCRVVSKVSLVEVAY